jgi:hypothetical protein
MHLVYYFYIAKLLPFQIPSNPKPGLMTLNVVQRAETQRLGRAQKQRQEGQGSGFCGRAASERCIIPLILHNT